MNTMTPTNPSEVTSSETTERSSVYQPDVDILEGPQAVKILIDLPGVPVGNVDVDFEKGVLTITARTQRTPPGGRRLLQEFTAGDFHRSFRVGQGLQTDAITAEHRDGVLDVTLPKAQSSRPNRIEVKGR